MYDVCLFDWLFVCLLACLFVCVIVCLFVCCLFVCSFVCLLACLLACLSVCLLACLFVCLLVFVHLFVCVSVCLSACLFCFMFLINSRFRGCHSDVTLRSVEWQILCLLSIEKRIKMMKPSFPGGTLLLSNTDNKRKGLSCVLVGWVWLACLAWLWLYSLASPGPPRATGGGR